MKSNKGSMRLAKCKFNFTCSGYGYMNSKKVRVYHRFWRWLLPAKVSLNWNDEDAMPFVYYQDLKRRLLFGSSDERIPDLFCKIEQVRFEYPDIILMGRVWKKRKIIVFENVSCSNLESKYSYLDEFTEIAGHYIDALSEYQLILPKTESKGEVYMNTIKVFIEECFFGQPLGQITTGNATSGGMKQLKIKKKLY